MRSISALFLILLASCNSAVVPTPIRVGDCFIDHTRSAEIKVSRTFEHGVEVLWMGFYDQKVSYYSYYSYERIRLFARSDCWSFMSLPTPTPTGATK